MLHTSNCHKLRNVILLFFLNRGFCLAGLCIGVYCHLKQFFNYLLLLDLLKKEHPDIGCVFGNLNT